ncbi:hypothetical protein BC830DRAFT_121829 [Chytriomyces sp. MP71]|nr:hypothetical protein BC830DRAFT_121829 [Chytriomyces sp. MP71]
MWLAKVDGLKSLSIGSDALISALTTCITSSKTIYEIGIQFTDTAAPVKKRDNERTTQNKRKDGNRIGKKPAQAWMTPLCEALVQRGKQLMELRDVSASVHDADTTEVAATTLVDEAEDAAETSGFHSLVLRLNNLSLGDEDMTVLAEAISQMKTGIEELTLFENSITAAGASTLLKAFSPGSLISTLNLEGNEIGPGCGKELHSFLSLPTQLKTFIIARNPIGDYGVKQLCEGLSKNTVPLIEDLDVRRTNMGSNGIKALSNMLAENATIKYLDISENDLKSDAFEAMGETLKKNSTLLQLNMQNLDCGPDGIDHLVDGLKSKSCPLEHLYFDSNNLGNSASAKILSCATSNFTIGIAENSITGEEPFLQIMQQKILSSEVTEVYLLGEPWF